MGLTFNGVTSDSLGVIVDGYYAKSAPVRRVKETAVPGRNGSLLTDEGVYDNITIEYDLYWLSTTTDESVTNWLKQNTYYKLIDSDNPGYYRMAQVYGGIQIINHGDCYHSARVSFNCKPQLFLTSGETVTEVRQSGSSITNGTQFPALPLITVHGSGAGSLNVGGSTIAISAIDGYVTLDCELKEAYKGSVNKNSTITGHDFPVLNPGANTITWTGGITYIEIMPRWWTV